MIRPRILVDMDGVLADFDLHVFNVCSTYGWELDCTRETQRHRFLTDHLVREHAKKLRSYINGDDFWFHDLPVLPGAIEGMNELAEHADVWICTKPLEANGSCRDGKGYWVRRHLGAEWEKRLIITPDKGLVAGDILLDDAPKLKWLYYSTWQPVIFTWPWNGVGSQWADFPHWTWADGVDQLVDYASSLRAPSGH